MAARTSLPVVKGLTVVHYRTFRNNDPPILTNLWNQIFTGRGAAILSGTSELERLVFAKPYFDPAGLILAEENGQAVGFAHAGFGPTPEESALSTASGVLCVVGVLPSHRRRGIGSELVRRAQAYLCSRGAQGLYAGSVRPMAPFYLGLYGGSEAPGFLDSDADAEPFLAHNAYGPCSSTLVLQRRLDGPIQIGDARFAALRRAHEMRITPRTGRTTWWRECTLAPLELVDFRLEDKLTGKAAALASLWDMDTYGRRWRVAAVGILHLEVREDLRRLGIGRYFLSQIFRHLQEQFFILAEAQVAEKDAAAHALLRGVGFEQVDKGHLYQFEGEPDAS